MIQLLMLLLSTFEFSFAAIPNDMVLQGVDIRNKSDRYVLYVGPENSVLEERDYKLKKIVGRKEVTVRQGRVVFVRSDLKKDMEALYTNETIQIQIGRALEHLHPRKQVVVFKVKNTPKTIGQTVVFENRVP